MPLWAVFICYLVALFAFLAAAFDWGRWRSRVNLVGLGLALYILVPFVNTLKRL